MSQKTPPKSLEWNIFKSLWWSVRPLGPFDFLGFLLKRLVSDFNLYYCPCPPHAFDAVVYTSLFNMGLFQSWPRHHCSCLTARDWYHRPCSLSRWAAPWIDILKWACPTSRRWSMSNTLPQKLVLTSTSLWRSSKTPWTCIRNIRADILTRPTCSDSDTRSIIFPKGRFHVEADRDLFIDIEYEIS